MYILHKLWPTFKPNQNLSYSFHKSSSFFLPLFPSSLLKLPFPRPNKNVGHASKLQTSSAFPKSHLFIFKNLLYKENIKVIELWQSHGLIDFLEDTGAMNLAEDIFPYSFQGCNFQKERIACFLSGLQKFRVTVRLKACLRNLFS